MADATWDGFVSGDWDTVTGTGKFGSGSNWNPAVLPDGTAVFPLTNVFNTNITFSSPTTRIQNIQFTGAPLVPLYTFTLAANILEIQGNGLLSAQGQIFNATGGFLFFDNASSAGQAIINVAGKGLLFFQNDSTAGSATITNNSSGKTEFISNSTAGSASIVNNSAGLTNFFDHSSAGSAAITNNSGGETDFASTARRGLRLSIMRDSTLIREGPRLVNGALPVRPQSQTILGATQFLITRALPVRPQSQTILGAKQFSCIPVRPGLQRSSIVAAILLF